MTAQPTLFVYYKVPISELATTQDALNAFRAELLKEISGLSVTLMRRPEQKNAQETWMEVYSATGGVTGMMQELIQKRLAQYPKLSRWPRSMEIFVPLE